MRRCKRLECTAYVAWPRRLAEGGRDSALSLVASQLPMFRFFKDHQMGEQGQLSAKLYRYLQSETF